MSKQKFITLTFQHLYRTIYSATLIRFLTMISTAFTAYKNVRANKELKNMGNMAVGRCATPKRRGRGEGLPGYKPPVPAYRNLRNTDFIDTTTPKVIRNSPYSRNHPLKSADE